MEARRRFCTFNLDQLWFGIPVERVQEVFASSAVTPVPLAPCAVAGLINLRGQIVTVIDPRRRLGFAERPAAMKSTMVVVRSENANVGLLVDEIGEVVEAPDNSLEATPGNVPAGSRELVPSVCKFPEGLLHLLDLDGIFRGSGPEVTSGKILK